MKKATLVSIFLIMLFLLTSCFRKNITIKSSLPEDTKITTFIENGKNINTQNSANNMQDTNVKKIYGKGDIISYQDYNISIDDIVIRKNTIILVLGFTNNSSNPICFDTYVYTNAFQDGIALLRGPLELEGEDLTYATIQTGKTVPVYVCYELRNFTNAVDIEIGSYDDKQTITFADFPEISEVFNVCDFYGCTVGDLIKMFGDDYTISDEYYDGGKLVSFKNIPINFFISWENENSTSAMITVASGNVGTHIIGNAVVGMTDKEISDVLGTEVELIYENYDESGDDGIYCSFRVDEQSDLIINFDSNLKSISAQCFYNH